MRPLRVRFVGRPPFWLPVGGRSLVDFILTGTLVVQTFPANALMSFAGSQAFLGLLFFSPSAAALCRGTPDPTLGFPGRPAGRPGTQPGPDPGPVLLGDVPGRDSARLRSRAGPGPGRARAGPSRARSRLARRGFRRQAGVAVAGLPVFGMPGSARTVLTRSGHSVAASALLGVSVVVPVRALGADRGRARCLDVFARLSGSLVAPRGFGCAGLRPPLFFAPSSALARAGPGPSASSPAGAAGRE